MKHLKALYDEVKQEFAEYDEQLKELHQKLAKLQEQRKARDEEIKPYEMQGLAERVRNVFRAKKDITKEIEETEAAIAFIEGEMKKQIEQNTNKLFTNMREAITKDWQNNRESVKPKLEKITELLDQALVIYQDIRKFEGQEIEECRELVNLLKKYITQNYHNQADGLHRMDNLRLYDGILESYYLSKRYAEANKNR